ncbi:hypothetical protein ABZ713_15745, partial [Streptomyces sp. NPDC006875]
LPPDGIGAGGTGPNSTGPDGPGCRAREDWPDRRLAVRSAADLSARGRRRRNFVLEVPVLAQGQKDHRAAVEEVFDILEGGWRPPDGAAARSRA